MEPYKNITHPILFHCNECGYEWKSRPRTMMRQDSMCPVCRKKKRLKKVLIDRDVELSDEDNLRIDQLSLLNPAIKYTTAEFIWLISKVNSTIDVMGEYTGIGESIKCKCKECGNIWHPKAQHILNGHGCPECNFKIGK
ncbi:MAG: hypothetical protein IKG17_05440 [Mogibacterium sp.]|nr:hypothetical protein [Mogibacterium sp.]